MLAAALSAVSPEITRLQTELRGIVQVYCHVIQQSVFKPPSPTATINCAFL